MGNKVKKSSQQKHPKMMVYIGIDKLRAALINMTEDKEKKDTCSSGTEKVYYPKWKIHRMELTTVWKWQKNGNYSVWKTEQ